MNKDFAIKFNAITNILILVLVVFGGFVWADTNGVWHNVEDLRGSAFGLDEQDLISGFSFIDSVSFNENVIYKGVELSNQYIDENQANSITTGMIVDGNVGSSDVSFNYAGSSSKGGVATNSDKLDGYDWNSVPLIKDKDDANYYVDPATITRLNTLRVVTLCDENGANCNDMSSGLGGSTEGFQAYASSGSYTFTVPTGVTRIWVDASGGGGGGGGGSAGSEWGASPGGGGGGAGQSVVGQAFTGLSSGQTITITVGVSGSAGASGGRTNPGGNGGNGGTTKIGSYLTLTGGKGGTGGGSTAASIGIGGFGSHSGGDGCAPINGYAPNGDLSDVFYGGSGGYSYTQAGGGGGGGGATLLYAGANGGRGATGTWTNAVAGSSGARGSGGGGGGGAYNNGGYSAAGGKGGSGYVKIYW